MWHWEQIPKWCEEIHNLGMLIAFLWCVTVQSHASSVFPKVWHFLTICQPWTAALLFKAWCRATSNVPIYGLPGKDQLFASNSSTYCGWFGDSSSPKFPLTPCLALLMAPEKVPCFSLPGDASLRLIFATLYSPDKLWFIHFIRALEGVWLISVALVCGNSFHRRHPPERNNH